MPTLQVRKVKVAVIAVVLLWSRPLLPKCGPLSRAWGMLAVCWEGLWGPTSLASLARASAQTARLFWVWDTGALSTFIAFTPLRHRQTKQRSIKPMPVCTRGGPPL